MRLPGGYEIRPVRCPDCNTWGIAFDWSGHWGWRIGWELRLRDWAHPIRARRWQAGVKGLRALEGGGYSIDWSRIVNGMLESAVFTYAGLKETRETKETTDA